MNQNLRKGENLETKLKNIIKNEREGFIQYADFEVIYSPIDIECVKINMKEAPIEIKEAKTTVLQSEIKFEQEK